MFTFGSTITPVEKLLTLDNIKIKRTSYETRDEEKRKSRERKLKMRKTKWTDLSMMLQISVYIFIMFFIYAAIFMTALYQFGN